MTFAKSHVPAPEQEEISNALKTAERWAAIMESRHRDDILIMSSKLELLRKECTQRVTAATETNFALSRENALLREELDHLRRPADGR